MGRDTAAAVLGISVVVGAAAGGRVKRNVPDSHASVLVSAVAAETVGADALVSGEIAGALSERSGKLGRSSAARALERVQTGGSSNVRTLADGVMDSVVVRHNAAGGLGAIADVGAIDA